MVGVDRPINAPSTAHKGASSKAVVGVDRPIKAPSTTHKGASSKAVVGVDRPIKALSMHIQKPYKGIIV